MIYELLMIPLKCSFFQGGIIAQHTFLMDFGFSTRRQFLFFKPLKMYAVQSLHPGKSPTLL